MFEMKKKNKTHKPTRSTWPPKPTSSHFSFLPHHIRSLLKGALMKFMWEPCFGYGLHILNTYPHYTDHLEPKVNFSLPWIALHAFFFCRITQDYFSNRALNERSVDSNWGVVAVKEHYYFFSFLSSFLSRCYFL